MLKLLIVADSEIVREKLRLVLQAQPEWEVCGESTSGSEAINTIATLKPDVILVDLSVPEISGVETVRRFRELGRNVRIIILTMHDQTELADAARLAGADGRVVKTQVEDLVPAIDTVLAGGIFFPESSSGPQEAIPQKRKRKATGR